MSMNLTNLRENQLKLCWQSHKLAINVGREKWYVVSIIALYTNSKQSIDTQKW